MCRCRSRSSRSRAPRPPRSPTARRCGPSRSAEIKPEDYTDFYRSVAGQFDEPALTVHFRAEGRHEYTALAFVPSSRPFDLFDPDRKGRIKLYVKRVFITDDAEILPRYLRFVRGLVDSADLPLNVSREMIQESPILAAIKKSVTGRVLGEFEKLADKRRRGLRQDLGHVRRRSSRKASTRTSSGATRCSRSRASRPPPRPSRWRTPEGLRRRAEAEPDRDLLHRRRRPRPARSLAASRRLPRPRHRGPAAVRSWSTACGPRRAPSFDGKPFKSVTQGAADLAAIPLLDAKTKRQRPRRATPSPSFIAFVKTTLGDAVSDVRASDRLTDSAVCLVASEGGPDRSLEKLLPAPAASCRPPSRCWRSIRAMSWSRRWPSSATTRPRFKEDAAHLLFDEARVLDGERPATPSASPSAWPG